MTTILQHRVVTHALFALVVFTTVASVANGIATSATVAPAAEPVAALPWPADVDRDARLSTGIAPQTAESLHAAIRSTAYTCNEVSGAQPNALTGGFTVECNHDAFSYEVWKRDGDWTAEPQR